MIDHPLLLLLRITQSMEASRLEVKLKHKLRKSAAAAAAGRDADDEAGNQQYQPAQLERHQHKRKRLGQLGGKVRALWGCCQWPGQHTTCGCPLSAQQSCALLPRLLHLVVSRGGREGPGIYSRSSGKARTATQTKGAASCGGCSSSGCRAQQRLQGSSRRARC